MCLAVTVFATIFGDPVINMFMFYNPIGPGQRITHFIIGEDWSWLYASVVADTQAGSTYRMHTRALFFILCTLNSVRYTRTLLPSTLLPSHIEVNAQSLFHF
ncbi:hypothetical protein VPH35_053158 [Triticum aestivum]